MQQELYTTSIPLTSLNSVDHLLHLPILLYITRAFIQYVAQHISIDMQNTAVGRSQKANLQKPILKSVTILQFSNWIWLYMQNKKLCFCDYWLHMNSNGNVGVAKEGPNEAKHLMLAKTSISSIYPHCFSHGNRVFSHT